MRNIFWRSKWLPIMTEILSARRSGACERKRHFVDRPPRGYDLLSGAMRGLAPVFCCVSQNGPMVLACAFFRSLNIHCHSPIIVSLPPQLRTDRAGETISLSRSDRVHHACLTSIMVLSLVCHVCVFFQIFNQLCNLLLQLKYVAKNIHQNLSRSDGLELVFSAAGKHLSQPSTMIKTKDFLILQPRLINSTVMASRSPNTQ